MEELIEIAGKLVDLLDFGDYTFMIIKYLIKIIKYWRYRNASKKEES